MGKVHRFSGSATRCRVFDSNEVAERNLAVVVFDAGHPFPFFLVPCHSGNARCRSATNGHVFSILLLSGGAQISPAVIAFIEVAVIDLVNWPMVSHVQPCESMGVVSEVVNFYGYIAALLHASGYRANCALAPGNPPSENASLRAVVKNLAQPLRGKIDCSHFAFLINVIGQRLGSAINTCRASLFSQTFAGVA